MQKLLIILSALSLNVSAENIGHIKFKINAAGRAAFMDAYFKKGTGMRMEMNASVNGESMNITTLKLDSKPNTLIMLNAKNKTYSETDISTSNKRDPSKDNQTYSVTVVGNETVAGYPCKHVKVTTRENEKYDLWTCSNLSGFEISELLHDNPEIRQHNFTKALTDANAMGAVLKMSSQKRGEEFVMEAVSIEKTEPAASLFQIPSGYSKSALAMPGMEHLTPEQQKMIQEMMEKAQREAGQHK